MSLAAITVNYRTPRATLDCIRALLPELRSGSDRVIVVENDSKDGSDLVLAEGIRENGWSSAGVELVLSPRNGGFGYGNNVGASHALAADPSLEYLLFINPDATIGKGSVAAMVDYFERHPDVAIVGARIRGEGGAERPSSFRFPSLWSELESSVRLGLVSRLLKSRQVAQSVEEDEVFSDWVSGAGLMVRASAWVELGGFDEEFFLYFEEIDLCRRAHDLGWKAASIRAAHIEHAQGLATDFGNPKKRMPRYWFESRSRYWRKHHGSSGLMLANLLWVGGYTSFRLRSVLQRKRVTDPPGLLGDFVRYNFWP